MEGTDIFARKYDSCFWLVTDYLVVAELAYDSRMFRRLLMDEGEFGPGF